MPEEISPTIKTPQPQPEAGRPLDDGRNWTKIILAAVLGFGLLFAAASVGYWYGTRQVQQYQLAPTEDETKGWKIYTNTTLGFEVKYPIRYSEPILPSGFGPITYADGTEIGGHIIFGTVSGPDQDGFILKLLIPFEGTLDELIREDQFKSTFYYWEPKENWLITSEEIEVDGREGQILTAQYTGKTDDESGNLPYVSVVFIDSEKGYPFVIEPRRGFDKEELNQILSTFKFLD